MLLLCYSLIQFIEKALGIWIIQKLYPDKREHSKFIKIMIILVGLMWGVISTWNAWAVFVSNSSFIGDSFCFSVLLFLYWKNSFQTVFIGEIFYNVTLMLFKMLFLILEGVWKQKTIFEINYSARNFNEIIWCLFIYFLLGVILYMKKEIFQLFKTILCKYKKALCLVCGIEWLMITYSMYLGKKGFSTVGFILHLIFIICAVMLTSYLMLNTLYQKIKIEKYVLDRFQSMLEKQNVALQSMYNQNNEKMHNVKHVMLYLGNCLEKGKTKEAQEQISGYIGELKDMEQKVWTNFPFLDFILNHKKMEMDEKKIAFHLEVDLYSIPLEEAELGVVLGNLFDNAIEAASQCELQRRKISLKIGNLNHMFLLSMKNTNFKMPRVQEGRLLTTKKDQYAHGLGVESVKRIVEKYNGDIRFQYDDEHFEVNILI